mgnify:CR=1 FL=1
MKKKRLFSRAAALAMAAILMVPSSIGTTVFAADASTETGAESTEPEVSVAPEENNGADTQTGASEETGTDATPEIKTGTETKTASEETEKPKETKKKQKYTVTLEDAENGMLSFPLSEKDSIKADPENPAKAMKEVNEQSLSSSKKYEEGSEVEIDAPAESGYTLEKIELTGKDGQKLQDLTVSEEGTVVFTMPEQDVTVKASFREWTEEEEESFDEELTEEELKESGLPTEEFTEESMQQDAEALSDESAINMASLNDTASSSARLAGAKSIYLSVGGKCRYGRYLTHYFSTNEGQYAYCMNPMKKTPGSGWYTGYLIGNEDARKAFYYCYGGPGYSQFVNATGWIGDGSQQYEYAYSHVILSYMYATYALHDSGRANSAFHGLSTGTRNALINKANQMRYMASPPAGYGFYYFETGRQPIAFQTISQSNLNLKKYSGNTDITNGNGMYTLNGAQYGVYRDSGCTSYVATLTTNANGDSNTITLDSGTYYVKEIEAPTGYTLDSTIKSVYLGNGESKTVSFTDNPIVDTTALEIQKVDVQTGDSAQGNGTLEGAEFSIKYYAGSYKTYNLPSQATRTWVIQTKKETVNGQTKYVAGFADKYKVGGSAFYYVNGTPVIPKGTITIEETKAPAGYKNNKVIKDSAGHSSNSKGIYLATIYHDGNLKSYMGGNTLKATDTYLRADLKFSKINGINNNPMANIPFKITNTQTGESHTVYTDSKGVYDSSAVKHSVNTNKEQQGAGLWFGDTKLLDDDLGALEYGTYTIEELSSADNKGMIMCSSSFTVNENSSKTIDLGKFVNSAITVDTNVYDAITSGNSILLDEPAYYMDASGNAVQGYALCDDVNVKGPTTGYVVGKVVDKETGNFVTDKDGHDLQGVAKLDESWDDAYTGQATVYIPFSDYSVLKGKQVVIFEYIYALKSDGTPDYNQLIASHTDMNDSMQTMNVQGLETELTDKSTGLHEIHTTGSSVTLTDKINYINMPTLADGISIYAKVEGTLMDASGNPVTDNNGNTITAKIPCTELTKSNPTPATSMEYTLPATVVKKYAGQKLTSFVTMYFSYTAEGTEYQKYYNWASEKDLTNEAQTVSIPAITNTYASTDNVAYTDTGISDEVDMVGLTPGNVYTLVGKIIDKSTGKVISSSKKCEYGKDEYDITKVEPASDGNYTLIVADPYRIYHLKRAVSFSGGTAEGYYRLNDDGKTYILCTESGTALEEKGVDKNDFETEVLYPGNTFKEINELTATKTFTAGKESMNQIVSFNFDPATLAGKSYVITQELYFSEKGFIGDADGDDVSGTTVYAVLYDDGNLDFQKRKDTYGSKTVVEVYKFDENDVFSSGYKIPWYSNRANVKTISARDNIMPVSTANWFYDMQNLTQLNIEKLDFKNTTRTDNMFYNCKALTELNIGSWDTGKVTNMGSMFNGCSKLTNLDIGSWDTSKVTSMNFMFNGCSNLTSLDVRSWNTGNVTNTSSMFSGCSNLTSLDVGSWDTSKVTDMNSMFSGCSNLTSLDVGSWDTSKVTDMSLMFQYCSSLTSLNVGNWNTHSVTNMMEMFYGLKKIIVLDLSSFDTQNVTNMLFMFAMDVYDASGASYPLKTIYVSDLWNIDKVTTGSGMFSYCNSLVGQSGVKYNGKSDISMANYKTGYLTYKAATQSASTTDLKKSVVAQAQSLNTDKKIKTETLTTMDKKEKKKESVVTKILDFFELQDNEENDQPVVYADTSQTPTLLYQHNDLNDANETFYVPEIDSTSLVNTSSEHYFAPSAGTTLVDNVTYKGLKPGTKYTLTGQLMDKDTQTATKDASGNVITATKEFTPTSSDGTVQVTFTFDGSNLGGKTLVAFETLSGIENAGTVTAATKTLAVHKDINDVSQTVTNMGISTVAKDKASGSKQVTLSSKTTITDTVSYKGAVAGYKYQLQAVLMDKLTGEAAVDGDGQPITGSKDFTASATSGSATVDLTFNGVGMPGGEYVVYETLYRITGNGSMEKWASHEDMNDKDQLVNVPGITTQLVDAATNTQFVKASSSVNAVDTVYYEGLIPGQSYTLTGQLIEKATGKVFVDGNGKEMTVTKTFTPAEKSGEVDVEFTLNATNLNTSSLVAYETLSLNGKEIVSEKSLDNEYQTLSFPVITSTTAVDKRNGTKVIDAQDDMTIVDTISYTGMQTGLPLTVKSTVMDKATGKAAKDSDGNDIIVESEILPDETNGSIDVEIPIKGRNLMGKTLVVYEEICYADGVVIAQHKDLKDAGQTVTVAGITTTAAIQTTAGQNDRYTSQTVRDTVKYYGLTKGTSYTLQGTLMDKATGNAYQENGKDVTASKTFKASATGGTETLDFEISSSEAKNKTLVVCESVYTAVDGKQVLVAQHSDLTDKDQTVEVPDETVGKLKVTKTIQNGNKNKAFKFTITLKGSRIKDSMMLSGVTFTNGVGTISLKHGESKLIEDIPSGTTYRVVEEQSGLYRPIMTTGDAGTIEDGKTAEASFVNIHLKEEEPGEDEVNLTVSKKVLPEDAGAGEKFQFTAVFEHLRANWNYGLSDETEFQSDADGKATVTFTLGKGENVTFLHLPAGCTYRFTEAAGAYTSSYAVTDAAGLQKIATASGANTEEDQEISTATETADKGEKVTVTFTNEFQMSQDLTLTKKTVNADGSAYNAKESFSFTVKFTGLPANAVISSTAGDVTADASGNAAKNISLKNGGQVIFHELPVGSKYQITENGSEYRPSYSIDAATVVKKTDRIVKRNSSLSTQIETIDKGENDAVTFTNERIVWYALPNTGSYMLVILIGTALIMLMIASRKRKDYLSEK